MVAETLEYKGQFDGSQIVSSLHLVDAEFVKMDKTAQAAFTGVAKSTIPAAAGIKSVEKAEKDLSAETELMVANHEIGFRTIKRAAGEGFASVRSGLASVRSGALESAGAMDILSIALGAAFHGPLTLAIVGAAAAVAFLTTKINEAKEEARDVKWFGDEAEVTQRFQVLTSEYEELKRHQDALLNPQQGGFAAGILAANNAAVNGTTEAKKKQLDIVTRLNERLVEEMRIESQIAEIEADKIRKRGESAVRIAQAESIAESAVKPIAKMKAQQEEVVAEKQLEFKQLELLIKEHGLQAATAQDQMDGLLRGRHLEQLDKKEKEEYGKYAIAHKKLEMNLAAENAMYKAKGEEMLSITKAQGIDILNEKIKIAAKITKTDLGQQSDMEMSPAYKAQLNAKLEAERKYQQDTAELRAEFRGQEAAHDADQYTVKLAQIQTEFDKKKAIYEADEQAEAKRTGDSIAANQRMVEKIELLESISAQKRKNIEAERATKVKEINSQLTASLISDSAAFVTAIAGRNKALFAISKALAAAEIVMNANVAAEKVVGQLGIFGLPAEGLVYADMAVKLATVAATTIQGFATGTNNAPRGMAWVGERGPELVDFSGGERVYTNSESNSIVRNQSSASSIVIHKVEINGSNLNQSQLTAAISDGVLDAVSAKQQQELNRGADFFNDGTFQP